MSMDSQTAFSPKGLLFGILLPGAGHMATGQVARGLLIAAGVLGLFFGGLFIGGIDVVDSEEDRVWFLGEAFVGPLAFGVDAAHQNLFKAYDPAKVSRISTVEELAAIPRRSAYPDEMRTTTTLNLVNRSTGQMVSQTVPVFAPATAGKGPPNKKSISKVNELGTLFATIAGMMNVIALIDAAFPTTRRKDGPAQGAAQGTAQAGGKP
jgi:TM2 domain-containing membrane protein YozV